MAGPVRPHPSSVASRSSHDPALTERPCCLPLQSASPYKGGSFKLTVEFANEYPFKGASAPRSLLLLLPGSLEADRTRLALLQRPSCVLPQPLHLRRAWPPARPELTLRPPPRSHCPPDQVWHAHLPPERRRRGQHLRRAAQDRGLEAGDEDDDGSVLLARFAPLSPALLTDPTRLTFCAWPFQSSSASTTCSSSPTRTTRCWPACVRLPLEPRRPPLTLCAPGRPSCALDQVAEIYRTDRKKYDATAKEWVKKVRRRLARSRLARARRGVADPGCRLPPRPVRDGLECLVLPLPRSPTHTPSRPLVPMPCSLRLIVPLASVCQDGGDRTSADAHGITSRP